VLSPLLANIALSVLDEHLHRAWESGGVLSTDYWRGKRRAQGLPSWRLVRYADLCRARHKSAYAEARVMPTRGGSCLVGGRFAVLESA
jgi:RNA-directed DNA polymerase